MSGCPEGMMPAPGGGCINAPIKNNSNSTMGGPHGGGVSRGRRANLDMALPIQRRTRKKGGRTIPVVKKYPHGGMHANPQSVGGRRNRPIRHSHAHNHPHGMNDHLSPATPFECPITCQDLTNEECNSIQSCNLMSASPHPCNGNLSVGDCMIITGAGSQGMKRGGRTKPRRKFNTGGHTHGGVQFTNWAGGTNNNNVEWHQHSIPAISASAGVHQHPQSLPPRPPRPRRGGMGGMKKGGKITHKLRRRR